MSFLKKSAFVIALFFTALQVNYAGYISADDTTGRDDTRSFHLANDLEMNSSVHFQYGKPRIVIKAIYPDFQSETRYAQVDALNQAVLQLVKNESRQYQARVNEFQSPQIHVPKSKLKNTFYIDYSSISGDISRNFVLSLRFSLQGNIIGMAHPYHYHRVINYDLTQQRMLALSDLFKPNSNYLVAISDYSRTVLSKRLSNKDMIQKGTEPVQQNFNLWNFASNGLLFTFEEYQVAPYVNGAQTVLVPYSVLADYIPSDSPLYKCVTKKRTCMVNIVKTGGFIDEIG